MCSMAFHESKDHVLVSKLQHLVLGTCAFMYLLESMKNILLVLVPLIIGETSQIEIKRYLLLGCLERARRSISRAVFP